MGKNTLIKAGSILGSKPSGVEQAPDALLDAGLRQLIANTEVPIKVETRNYLYSTKRGASGIINAQPLRDFSIALGAKVGEALDSMGRPIVLGGDCSILIGIAAELKRRGRFGVVSFDAHADFYEPSQSTTGEAADMDIALITGRGGDVVCNIHDGRPYILDEDIIHFGQRDQAEATAYGSARLQDTNVQRLELDTIRKLGINEASAKLETLLRRDAPSSYWLHIDTDVLHDDDNPAVDYRLPDGLHFDELEQLLYVVLASKKIVGVSVAIYNPLLDETGDVGKRLAGMLTTC